MKILHIAGYKFITLSHLHDLRSYFLKECTALELKGTILLSKEGINIMLAGTKEHIQTFQSILADDTHFENMHFHETATTVIPFKKLKIKIKNEIITLRQPQANPTAQRAPSIDPIVLKQWLDEKRDITLLDTRNNYEVAVGTFAQATHLALSDFSHFPTMLDSIDRNKPIVLFCTGGIRCEKAALYMQQSGYKEIYQLEGGILGYFAKVGGAHYQGQCFVFDERESLNPQLESGK